MTPKHSVIRRLGFALALSTAIAAFFAPASARAADWPVPRGPSQEPDPVAYDAAWLNTIPQDLLNEHEACYLLGRDVHELLPSGKVRITHHFIARVNSRNALEVLGDWPLWFDASCEQVMLNEARVHKPDGRTIEVAPEDVHVRDENTDFYEFDELKNLIVSFSQLAVGDVVEVKYTRNLNDPQFNNQYFSSFLFCHEEYPIQRSELLVCLPAGKSLKHKTWGAKAEPEVVKAEGGTQYRWKLENVAPCPLDDDLPRDNSHEPLVDFSTFASWDEVGRAFTELRSDRDACPEDVHRHVESLTRGLTSPLEKTRVLAQWCRDNVRYLSIHHGAFGYRPHPPAQVFAKRYGDCNDVCQLLHIMLRKAGVESEFVFLNTDATVHLSHEVPSPMAEHVVLLVELDGVKHWLDPTATWSAWDVLRGDLYGRKAFGLKQGKIRLLETPKREPADYHVEQVTEIDITIGGDTDWRVTRTAFREAAETWRSYLLTLVPAQRKADVFDDFVTFYSSARLADRDRLETNLRDVDDPLRLKLAFRVPRQLADDGEEQTLDVASPLLHHYFSLTKQVDRGRPLRVDAREIVDRATVRLPVVYELTGISEDSHLESKWGSVDVTAAPADDGRSVAYTWRAQLKQGRVEADEIGEFNQFLDDATDLVYCSIWCDFPLAFDRNTIRLLRRELLRRPLDPHAAGVIIDALRFAEEYDEASAAVQTALEAAPDARILWEHKAGLTSTESERQKVLAELTRRWPEEPEYRRLLAQSLLETKQPAEALRVAEAAVKSAADADTRVQALILVARARIAAGKPAEALADLDRADLADVDALHEDTLAALRGAVCVAQGKFDEAETLFDLALEVNPDHAEALAGAVGVSLRLDEDHADARSLLRRLIAVAEHSPEHMTLAARTCLTAQRYEDAGDLAQLALDQNPEDGEAAAVLILVRHQAKQFREALEVSHDNVDSPDALAALLESSLTLNRRQAAGEIAAKARKILETVPAGEGTESLRKQLARFDALAP